MYPGLKILTLDNQPLFLRGILACLREWSLVDKAEGCANYDEMLSKLKEDQPHLVFLELNLNNNRYDGFSICRDLTHRYKDVFVAVLSRYNSPHLIKEAYECGARAFFDKKAGTDTLYEFLLAFCENRAMPYYVKVYDEFSQRWKDGFEQKYILTRRERDVMGLIIQGHDYSEIEKILSISYSTLKTHRANILRKLNLKNDVELTRFAVGHSLYAQEYALPRFHFPPAEQAVAAG